MFQAHCKRQYENAHIRSLGWFWKPSRFIFKLFWGPIRPQDLPRACPKIITEMLPKIVPRSAQRFPEHDPIWGPRSGPKMNQNGPQTQWRFLEGGFKIRRRSCGSSPRRRLSTLQLFLLLLPCSCNRMGGGRSYKVYIIKNHMRRELLEREQSQTLPERPSNSFSWP